MEELSRASNPNSYIKDQRSTDLKDMTKMSVFNESHEKMNVFHGSHEK